MDSEMKEIYAQRAADQRYRLGRWGITAGLIGFLAFCLAAARCEERYAHGIQDGMRRCK